MKHGHAPRRLYACLLLCCLALFRPHPAFALGDLPDLTIEEIAAIVRADYDVIRTIDVTFLQERVSAPENKSPGMWFRRRFLGKDEKLLKEQTKGYRRPNGEIQRRGEETRSWDGEVQRLHQPMANQALITQESNHHLFIDNKFYLLSAYYPSAALSGSGKKRVSLNGSLMDFLNDGNMCVIGQEAVQGRLCYILGWKDSIRKQMSEFKGAGERRIWIAPSEGFAPIRDELRKVAGERQIVYRVEILETQKIDGFTRSWPKRARITYGNKDAEDTVEEYEITALEINREIDDEVFAFKFPFGTQVEDRVMGINYRIPDFSLGDVALESLALGAAADPPRAREQLEGAAMATPKLPDVPLPPDSKLERTDDAPEAHRHPAGRRGLLAVCLVLAGALLLAVILVRRKK